MRVFEKLPSLEVVDKLYRTYCDLRSDFEEVRHSISRGALSGVAARQELQRLQHRLAQGHQEVREAAATPSPPAVTTGVSEEAPAVRPKSGAAPTAKPRRRREPRVHVTK